MKKNHTFSNISNKKPQKLIFTSIKTSTNRSPIRKNQISKIKKHSNIFNYEGLKTAIFKYNSLKYENKSINIEIPIKQNINKKNDSERKLISINDDEEENIKYISKLKEMNSNMDLILTGLKVNLGNNNNIKRKNIINVDNFIQQIDNIKEDSLSSDKKIDNNQQSESYEKSFSSLSITNFNFELIYKKKYYIDINKLSKNDKY